MTGVASTGHLSDGSSELGHSAAHTAVGVTLCPYLVPTPLAPAARYCWLAGAANRGFARGFDAAVVLLRAVAACPAEPVEGASYVTVKVPTPIWEQVAELRGGS